MHRPCSDILTASQSLVVPGLILKAQATLLSYAQVVNFQADKTLGCEAIRRSRGSEMEYARLNSSFSTCSDIIENGWTIYGTKTCKADNDCYTRCANQRCQIPLPEGFGKPKPQAFTMSQRFVSLLLSIFALQHGRSFRVPWTIWTLRYYTSSRRSWVWLMMHPLLRCSMLWSTKQGLGAVSAQGWCLIVSEMRRLEIPVFGNIQSQIFSKCVRRNVDSRVVSSAIRTTVVEYHYDDYSATYHWNIKPGDNQSECESKLACSDGQTKCQVFISFCVFCMPSSWVPNQSWGWMHRRTDTFARTALSLMVGFAEIFRLPVAHRQETRQETRPYAVNLPCVTPFAGNVEARNYPRWAFFVRRMKTLPINTAQPFLLCGMRPFSCATFPP